MLRDAILIVALLGFAHGQVPPAPPASPARPALPAQTDPVIGNWRGTLSSSAGTETPIILTIAKRGGAYVGSTNGLNAPSEIPLARLAVDGNRVTIEAASESRLGDISLTGELTAEGTAMKGVGTLAVGAQKFAVTFALQRRPRA